MEKHFVCTAALSSDMYPGRHVTVKNVSADAPVPQDIAYALRPLPPTITVVDPHVIDAGKQAREAREAAAWLVEAKRPRHSYTSAEAAARLGLSLDGLTECIDHLGLSRPRMAYETHGLNGPVRGYHLHDGPTVDCYAERLDRLFGKRKAAK